MAFTAMNINIASIQSWLQVPIPVYTLAIFRIGFGLFMVGEMIYYWIIGLIRNMFFLPAINFKYDFLYWLKPLPEPLMNLLLAVLLVAAACMAAGILFKWSCRVFTVGFAYLFLLDKSIYNNHIYLFILLAFLLSFTDADKALSLGRKKESIQTSVPRWQLFILQLQFVIVYFYGGLAKLTHDWLMHCEPIKTLVRFMPDGGFLALLFKNDFGIYMLTYGGLALDILSPLLLWYKPIRKWAILLFVGFHFLNGIIFHDIGIFPYVMLFSLLLFYETYELPLIKKLVKPARKIAKIRKAESAPAVISHASNSVTPIVLSAFFGFQFLFPLRGHLLPNDLDWTTIGNRFAWRMKVDTRQVERMDFVVHDPLTQQSYPMEIRTLINDAQLLNLSMDPRSVRDFSHHLAAIARQNNVASPEVYADIQVRYNGRDHVAFVDPKIDLMSVRYAFTEKLNWVMPVPRTEPK